MRFIYIAFTCGFIGLISCNNNGTTGTTNTTDSTKHTAVSIGPIKSKLSDTGTSMLMSVVTNYYALKNALVATKAATAETAATGLTTATDSMLAFLQKDPANAPALKPCLDTILTQSKLITTIKDETCEKQRLAFSAISNNMYKLLQYAGLRNAHIYHEYCPMAFNDKGATWLSDESEIKNPYFGKKMMECGEVTDSL